MNIIGTGLNAVVFMSPFKVPGSQSCLTAKQSVQYLHSPSWGRGHAGSMKTVFELCIVLEKKYRGLKLGHTIKSNRSVF